MPLLLVFLPGLPIFGLRGREVPEPALGRVAFVGGLVARSVASLAVLG